MPCRFLRLRHERGRLPTAARRPQPGRLAGAAASGWPPAPPRRCPCLPPARPCRLCRRRPVRSWPWPPGRQAVRTAWACCAMAAPPLLRCRPRWTCPRAPMACGRSPTAACSRWRAAPATGCCAGAPTATEVAWGWIEPDRAFNGHAHRQRRRPALSTPPRPTWKPAGPGRRARCAQRCKRPPSGPRTAWTRTSCWLDADGSAAGGQRRHSDPARNRPRQARTGPHGFVAGAAGRAAR